MRYAVISTALFGAAMFMTPGSQKPVSRPQINPLTASTVRLIQKPMSHVTLADKTARQTTTPSRAAQAPQPASPTNPPATNMVTVAAGDSLSTMAAAEATTYGRLYDANPVVTDPDLIFAGQQLRVPSADETLAVRELPASASTAATSSTTPSVVPTRVSYSPTAPAASTIDGNVWDALAQCESGGNWAINTGNGFYGGIQFTLATWQSLGGSGLPSEASREEQISRGQMLQARSGWGQWPACSAKLGLR